MTDNPPAEPTCESICVHLDECVCEVKCGVRNCGAPYDSLLDLVLSDMEAEYEEAHDGQ